MSRRRDDRRWFWRRWLLKPALALLVINAAVLSVVTLPRLLEERHSEERLASLRRSVAEQERRSALLRERAENARRNEQELQRFYGEVACADDTALLELLEDLESALDEVGVESQRRSWSRSSVIGTPLDRIEIALPAAGSYRQLVDLIGRLEGSPHFVIVDEVRLRGEDRGGALELRVSTYCRQRESA